MPLSLFLPLRIAVPLFVLIVLSALALGNGLLAYQQLSADLQRDVSQHLRTVMGMLQRSANAGYRLGNVDRIEADLAQVSLNRFVQRVLLVDEQGDILLSGTGPGKGEKVGDAYDPELAATVQQTGTSTLAECGELLCGYFRVNRYQDAGTQLRGNYAMLYLEYGLAKHREAELNQILLFLASLLLGIVIAAILLWFFLRRVVTRRVEDLQYAAQLIADGDFSARSRVTGRDELGILAQEINRMAAEIEERQQQLEEGERRYRLLFESAGDAIYLFPIEDDRPGRFTAVNEQACRLLGYSREELLQLSPMDVDDPLYAENIPSLIHKLQRDGSVVFSNVHRTRDGESVEVEISAHLFEVRGRLMVLSISRRLTDRHQLEQQLQHFKSTLDMIDDRVLMFDDADHRFIYANHGAERALGYTQTELEQLTPFDLMPNLQVEWLSERLAALGRDEINALRLESELSGKGGGKRPVDVAIQHIVLPGDGGRFILLARDISEQKRIRHELASANRALHTLSRCNMALVRSQNEAALLEQICRAIVSEGGYLLAWIGYAEEHDDVRLVVPQASAGVEPGYLRSIEVRWDESSLGNGPVGMAIRSGKADVMQDVQHEPRFAPWLKPASERGFESVLGLPLREGEEVIGALAIYAREVDAFTDEEVRLLEELAADLSFGISVHRTRGENIMLEQSRDEAEQQLRENLIETIMAMAAALEKRDPYTAGHQQRVAELAVAIAGRMQLPQDQIEGIRLGALIHDIGKIYVPSEILNRPGKLSDNEFALIKSHPKVGFEIIEDVHFPWPVAQMVRQHHERLDGSGYPDGLKGNDILLEAKILAVADVVEAITSHRPYRAGLGLEAAVDEIRNNRGRWYEPEVVDACVELLEKQGWSWQQS